MSATADAKADTAGLEGRPSIHGCSKLDRALKNDLETKWSEQQVREPPNSDIHAAPIIMRDPGFQA